MVLGPELNRAYTEEHLDIEVNSGKKEFSELRVLFKGII